MIELASVIRQSIVVTAIFSFPHHVANLIMYQPHYLSHFLLSSSNAIKFNKFLGKEFKTRIKRVQTETKKA